MSLSKSATGPLQTTLLYRIDDVIFWGPTSPPDVVPAQDDIEHTVAISDRIDLLANRYFGDPQLWWIIQLRNDLRLMPNDLVPGMKVYVPTYESLKSRGIIR